MATSSLSYTGPGDGNPAASFAHMGAIPDDHAAYFFAAYRAIYGQVPVTDQDGNPVTMQGGRGNNVPQMRDMSDAETFERYAQGIAAGTAAQVQRFVEEQAKAAAIAAVGAISVTQQS